MYSLNSSSNTLTYHERRNSHVDYSFYVLCFTATLLATTAIEPDADLEQMRAWIERFKEDEEEEVPES